MPSFDGFTEGEFEGIFPNILNLTCRDNTYKFALARFLLDYSREHGPSEAHVGFRTAAGSSTTTRNTWISTLA